MRYFLFVALYQEEYVLRCKRFTGYQASAIVYDLTGAAFNDISLTTHLLHKGDDV